MRCVPPCPPKELAMPARNTDNEKPGTRYGKRVVLSTDRIVIGHLKYVGLWVRCDCGRTDLVRKSALVAGLADQCKDCELADRAQAMRGLKVGAEWRAHRQSAMPAESAVSAAPGM